MDRFIYCELVQKLPVLDRLTAWVSPSLSSLWLESRVLESRDSSRCEWTFRVEAWRAVRGWPTVIVFFFFLCPECYWEALAGETFNFVSGTLGSRCNNATLELYDRGSVPLVWVLDGWQASNRPGVPQCAWPVSIKACWSAKMSPVVSDQKVSCPGGLCLTRTWRDGLPTQCKRSCRLWAVLMRPTQHLESCVGLSSGKRKTHSGTFPLL